MSFQLQPKTTYISFIQAVENAGSHSEALPNIVDPIYDAFCVKRNLAEAALRVFYENAEEDGLTSVERYYRVNKPDQTRFAENLTIIR